MSGNAWFWFNPNLGKFVDESGSPVEPPQDATVVLRAAGYWEDMPVGAIQGRCRICLRLIGYEPTAQELLKLLTPGRVVVIMCRRCFQAVQAFRAGDTREFDRIVEEVEKEEARREGRIG